MACHRFKPIVEGNTTEFHEMRRDRKAILKFRVDVQRAKAAKKKIQAQEAAARACALNEQKRARTKALSIPKGRKK